MKIIPIDRLFRAYDRELISKSEVIFQFVELLLAAATDDEALSLLEVTPAWFRGEFRGFLIDLAPANYRYASAQMGTHPLSQEEIELNTERHAEVLRRLAPRILARIAS